jgi:hypothetical protein
MWMFHFGGQWTGDEGGRVPIAVRVGADARLSFAAASLRNRQEVLFMVKDLVKELLDGPAVLFAEVQF